MNHKDMKRILKNLWTCGLLAIALLASTPAVAQRVVAKTNLLYWGTGTPNLGLEVAHYYQEAGIQIRLRYDEQLKKALEEKI